MIRFRLPAALPPVLLAIAVLAALLVARAVPAAEPAALAEGQVLRGRFVQERTLKGFAAPLKSEGRFLLAPGRGLIWQVEKPFAITTVMSPAGLMQEVRGNETMRLSAAKLPFMLRMYTMLGGALTGDWKALDGLFSVTRGSDAAGWSLDLAPLRADDPAMPIRRIAVRGNRFVDSVEIIKPEGDSDRLSFLDQSLSATAPGRDEEKLLESLGASSP
ncbi:hypothetical protein VY88_15150 [Azospirillum thiophilum]|uniref:Outer membrane lipoprotein carrier protein LolA n=1 Tax=Azospirillum thiophilum TaxID=528244 RepID=A0AAC8W0P5_9PROT|nr:outer membrane lipoprotein carrier protein LolA [Azospirillum thiophilum]ALG72918.1 hypothetical protein AL072_18355 [Azospirillum thiophilum]KJR64166.1 hypothetical protein VY88_15150 [Azospirillum thiophilum]